MTQHVQDINQRITQLQGSFQLLNPQNPKGADARAELERLRNERPDAFAELDNIDKRIGDADVQAAAGRTGLRIIEPAVTPSAARQPTTITLMLGAAVLAVALGIVAQLIARLADRRLRRRSDIAAAAGAPVLGTVQVPTRTRAITAPKTAPSGPHRRRHDADRRVWIGQLLRGDNPRQGDAPRQGDVPQQTGVHGQMLEDLRYQRVLAQLKERASGSARLLVVIPDRHDLAFPAVARLATTAAAEGTILDVLTVSTTRPTLPGCPGCSAALLVVVSGTVTAGQLLTVAQACQDAGCPAAGVLLVVRDTDEEDPEPLPAVHPGQPHGFNDALVDGTQPDGRRQVEPSR